MSKRRAGSDIPTGEELLKFAEEVCKDYEIRGYALTLRQLYYQGVARAFLPSGQKSYDALKETISRARLAGKFPLWALVDRTRTVYSGQTTRCDTNVETALRRAAEQATAAPLNFLRTDRWFGQPVHVSVWFEKEALAGIFEDVCQKLGVSWFSCRGDPSHPALFSWLVDAGRAHGIDNANGWRDTRDSFHRGLAKRSVVLYFGDHDPTGLRIPRTAEETVRTFMNITRKSFPLEFVRVGVTMMQARELDLPPFPAKQSAGKDYDDYIESYGTTDAWELDALPPETLEEMTVEAVNSYFDKDIYAANETRILERRRRMQLLMKDRAWHTAATNFGD